MATFTNIAVPQPDFNAIERNDRLLRIKNTLRQGKITEPSWIVAQRALYPNGIQSNPDPDDVILKKELSFQDNHPNIYLEKLRLFLLKLSGNDEEITNYILSNLNNDEIKTLVAYWNRFLKLVKENFPKGVSKETLLSFAQDFANNPNNISSRQKVNRNQREPIEQENENEIRDRQRQIERQLEEARFISTTPIGVSLELEDTQPSLYSVYQERDTPIEVHSPYTPVKSSTEKKQEKVYVRNKIQYVNHIGRYNDLIDKLQELITDGIYPSDIIRNVTQDNSIRNASQIKQNIKEYFQFEYNHNLSKQKEGYGFNKKHIHKHINKLKYGCGKITFTETQNHSPCHISIPTNPSLYVEINLLRNNNILSVKYKSNRNTSPKLPKQRVSQNLADFILELQVSVVPKMIKTTDS